MGRPIIGVTFFIIQVLNNRGFPVTCSYKHMYIYRVNYKIKIAIYVYTHFCINHMSRSKIQNKVIFNQIKSKKCSY